MYTVPIFCFTFSHLFSISLSPVILFSTSSDNNNLQTIATTFSKQQSNNLIPYINPINGIKVQYPSAWQLVEHGDNDYHKLNSIAEFFPPSSLSLCGFSFEDLSITSSFFFSLKTKDRECASQFYTALC